jgi:zona occludens toxin (predicted ATPase)
MGIMRKLFLLMMITFFAMVFSCVSAFAVTDAAVTLVSPPENEPVVTDNFLISVKVTQPGKNLKITAFEVQQKVNDKWISVKVEELEDFEKKAEDEKRLFPIMDAEKFESKGSVSFFTRKIEDITPGVYQIRVETVDGTEKVLYTREARILVKEKTEEEVKVFETSKSGTSQFLQSLLSKIFKN